MIEAVEREYVAPNHLIQKFDENSVLTYWQMIEIWNVQ